MSINVTVSGNPVNINRGKMVTADPDYAKKEFQKRRRMRLEQVRQQSKDIAEDVRNKVRREKKKQLSEIEEQGVCKLKQWQNRKLLELQQQYCECLKDIGLGHSEAAVQEIHEGMANAYQEVLKEKVKDRGYEAAKQLHEEKRAQNSRKAASLQHKKFTRDVEDTRSAMVAKIKKKGSPFKKKKRKKSTANINISTAVSESDSEVDSDVNMSVDGSCYDTSNSPYRMKSPTIETGETTTTTSDMKTKSPEKSKVRYSKQVPEGRKSPTTRRSRSRSGSPKLNKPSSKGPKDVASPTKKVTNLPLDTRISDRIKRRLHIPLHQPICDSYLNIHTENRHTRTNLTNADFTEDTYKQNDSYQTQPYSSKTDFRCKPCNPLEENISQTFSQKYGISRPLHRPDCKCQPCNDIPLKPKISLKDMQKSTSEAEPNKVQYYDHSNRYTKEYVCDKSCVQKIQPDSIQICPSTPGEQEFIEQIYKRDRDAQERGKKALEKEKIHKDYRELMQQLPVLQRQERIASINSNNPIFHMSDERLKLYKQKKQHQMEGAYEKCFPNTPLITIPPKNHVKQTEPFRTIDVRESGPLLNLATWEVDSNRVLTAMKDEGVISLSSKMPSDETGYLKALLEKVKMQKEMLMREVDSLPKDSNLINVINELGVFEKESAERNKKSEAQNKADSIVSSSTLEDEACYCPEKATYSHKEPSTSYKQTKRLGKKASGAHKLKHKIPSSPNSSSSPSPRKKLKHRRCTLILQNTSTQTSPRRTSTNSDAALPRPESPRKMIDGHFEVQIGRERPQSPKRPKSPERSDVSPKKIATSRSAQAVSRYKSKYLRTASTSPMRSKSPTGSTSLARGDLPTTKRRSKSPTESTSRLNDDEPGTNKISDSAIASTSRFKGDEPATQRGSKSPTNSSSRSKGTKPPHSSPPKRSKSPRSKRSKSPIKSGCNSLVPENFRPCDCKEAAKEEVCEILIKIKDDEPEIVIKSPTKTLKPLLVKADIHKSVKDNSKLKKQLHFQAEKSKEVEKKIVTVKGSSWRDHFTRNGSLGTSTSTSYYSPPDFSAGIAERSQVPSKKEKQDALSDPDGKKIDPRLLKYIRKLLTMSRASVEDLAVSTVSDISTPSSSLMNSQANDPLGQLKNVMRYFNLNPNDLARCLNYSDEADVNAQRNYTSSTSGSSVMVSQRHCTSGYEASNSQVTKTPAGLVSDDQTSTSKSESSGNEKSRMQSVFAQDVRQISLETYMEQNYPNALNKYAQIAEMCHQRISNLTEMIEKVRLEKQQMLSPNVVSDKENSTSYLNLPSRLGAASAASDGTTAKQNSPDHSLSTNSELEQAELDRKLLEIDYSFAEKLQKLSPGEMKAYRDRVVELLNSTKGPDVGDIDKDLLERYTALLDVDRVPIKVDARVVASREFEKRLVAIRSPSKNVPKEKSSAGAGETSKSPEKSNITDAPFVPLLLDIPRLPKLTPTSTKNGSNQDDIKSQIQETLLQLSSENGKLAKKPPPSKGLNAAKKFNGDITNVPHELSTIAEVDSQLSGKLRRSISPAAPPPKIFEQMNPLVVPQNSQGSVWTTTSTVKFDEKKDEELKPISDESLPDILAEVELRSIKLDTSDLKDKQVTKNEARAKEAEAKQKVQARQPNTAKILADKSTDSSTEKSELDNVESMLRSMGMGWAVATLRKTQEALTRASSSSSSLELGVKLPISDKSNSTEVSLRHFLDSKLLNKSSGSTSKTGSSLSPFVRELHDISVIQGSGLSSENKNQRTSTPVQTTKSSEKSKNDSQKAIFTAESDLSSVRAGRSGDNFLTMLGDYTATSSES